MEKGSGEMTLQQLRYAVAIADFMVELQDVYFSVVYSVRREGIKISVRSENHGGCHAGEIVIEALEGMGTAGGHQSMAGGYVSFRSNKEPVDVLINRIKENFKRIAVKYRDKCAAKTIKRVI